MIERNGLQDLTEMIIISIIALIVITYVSFSMGVITLPEKQAPEITQPTTAITPAPTSAVIEWTPEPTPTALPTLMQEYVDPFAPGQRSRGQWYKWYRPEVSGLKDLQVGIVMYRHAFLDRYTWFNPSAGNYFTQRPNPGNRYFAVWVHEEMIGETPSEDPSFWAFDDRAFGLQVRDELFTSEMNKTYNPIVRIKEFDELTDYYDTITAPPFGYYIRYTGTNPETGGFAAEKLSFLRMGKGNAHDGFILYEVPREAQLRDMQLLGEFGTFGSAAWGFD
jgi:hypothetical protein